MILIELERLQRSDFVRKETAREKYTKLAYVQGQDIYDYHTSWDGVIQDMRENHTLPDEETLIFDYKRKMDADAVLHVTRVDKPVTIDEWKGFVEAYFDTAQGIRGGPGRVIGAGVRRLALEDVDPAFQAR